MGSSIEMSRLGSSREQSFFEDKQITSEVVDRIRQAAALTKLKITELSNESLTLGRQVAKALRGGIESSFVGKLGSTGGVLGLILGANEMYGGKAEMWSAQKIGDAEGEQVAKARLLAGGFMVSGAAISLANQAIDTSAKIAFGIGLAANFLFGAASLFGMTTSSFGIYRSCRFHSRLNERLENPTLSEAEKRREALLYLQEMIMVSPQEKKAIIARIDRRHLTLSSHQREKLIQNKLKERAEAKVQYFRRRTSAEAVHLFLECSESILEKLIDPVEAAKGIREADQLLAAIQWESTKKIVLHIATFIATTIGVLAFCIAALSLTAGGVPFALYAISAAVYLGVSIHKLMCP